MDQELIERTTPEQLELEKKIAFIARVFSGDYGIEVLPSEDNNWACGLDERSAAQVEDYIRGDSDNLPSEQSLRPKQLYYGREDVRTLDEQAVLGILRHEVGHAKNTDYRSFFEGQRLAKDQGFLPLAFANIFNALEDPRINNIEIADSDTVRAQMERAYRAKLPQLLAGIENAPKTLQLGVNIIHHWATGESAEAIKDRDVLDVFEKIKEDVEQYFDERDPKQNFAIIRDKIWPHYRELETKSIEEQKKRELVKEAARDEKDQRESQNGSSEPPPEQPQKKPQGILDFLKGLFGGNKGKESKGKEQSQQASPESTQAPSAAEALSQEERETLKKELEQQQVTGAQGGSQNVDLEKLSPEALKSLENALQSMTAQQMQELEQKARRQIDQQYAEHLEKELPSQVKIRKDDNTGEHIASFGEPRTQEERLRGRQEKRETLQRVGERESETAAEVRREVREQRNSAFRQLRAEQAKREMEEFGFSPHEARLYQQFKALEASMAGHVRNFIRSLEEHLPRLDTSFYQGEYYSGSRLNKKAVLRRAPLEDYRIYQRRALSPHGDPRLFVTLIIDNSGSMEGQKMEESLKTAVFWGRVLKEFQIPFAIKIFDQSSKDIKSFREDYDSPSTGIKSRMMRSCTANGPRTNIGQPLVETEESLFEERKLFPNSMSAIFVISDSGANVGLVGDALKEQIRKMQQDSLVMNFILSQNPDELAQAQGYFGEENVVAPQRFEELPQEAFRALRMVLQNYAKRLL